MEVSAVLRGARLSAQKARLVADQIRGKRFRIADGEAPFLIGEIVSQPRFRTRSSTRP